MLKEISFDELKNRFGKILDRLTFFPDREFLSRFPYGIELIDASERFGGVEKVFDSFGRDTYFDAITKPIPSPEQKLAAVEIARSGMEGRKRLELSKPGARKTLSVLSAIPVINEINMPQLGLEEKVKTIICCPTYIIPIWMREAERLLHDPNIVVVTRRNREYAIQKAAEKDVDIVMLGYELSHRKSGIDFNDPKIKEEIDNRYAELLTTVFNKDDAYYILKKLMSEEALENYSKKNKKLDKILEKIILEEQNLIAASIAAALKSKAFNSNKPYYAIYDEIHNIIDPESATAIALSDLFIDAKWGAVVSGTGIRNEISNLAYLTNLIGRVEDPKDFKVVFRDNPKIIKSMFDLDANPIRELSDIDTNVPLPKFDYIDYSISEPEMDIYIGIINSENFDGKDKYLLLNYLLTNPKKLLPQNFKQTNSEESLRKKVEDFFTANPKFTEYIEKIIPSKLIKTKELLKVAKGKKTIIACEYSSMLTEFLEDELKEFGTIRIDQTVSPQLEERILSEREIEELGHNKLFAKGIKFRSDLTLKQRKLLGIKTYQIFYPSERDLALLQFLTNPDKNTLVVSYGTLREGADAQEASILVEYEATTVPSRFWQLLARMRRSGKEDQVEVKKLRGENTFELGKYKFRDWKNYLIELVFEGQDATPEEIEEFIQNTKPEKSKQIRSLIELNSRSVVAFMFNSLRGAGVERFVDEMKSYNNALFLAKNYNYEWDYSYSANCARLIREVVYGLENKNGRVLEDIIDEGSGPATVSRILNRKTTSIDINGFQLQFGAEACDDKKIIGNKYYLGSYTNLKNLISVDSDEKIFDPRINYENTEELKNNSTDLAVCSLALDFATENERKEFFNENKRVLKKNSYLLITVPTSKIDESCRKQFLTDIENIGFEVDKELTGSYRSRKIINVDTAGEERNGFEAYVVVAKKLDNLEPKYQDNRKYFVMKNQYKIVDPDGEEKEKSDKPEPRIRRYHCTDFYNVDADLAPKDIPPIEGIPIHPDIDDFNKGIKTSSEDIISDLEKKLNKLLGNENE